MVTILLVIQLVVAIALIGSVLIQRSDSDGMGLGGGGGGMGLLSGRAKANALTRTTAILAAIFMLNSLMLNVISGHSTSITDRIEAGKALSSEPTSKSTPLPMTKTGTGEAGVATHTPSGAVSPKVPAPANAASEQKSSAPAPLEAPAAK